MRSIGEIPNEADAKRFGDYLYANGIASDVDEDEGTWTVWIHDDEQITKAEEELSAAGIGPEALRFQRYLNLCYPGQTFDMAVPAVTDAAGRVDGAQLRDTIEAFHDLHEELHTYTVREEEPVVRSVRVQTVGITPKPGLREYAPAKTSVADALRSRRPAFFGGRFEDTPVYDGDELGCGHEFEGPAIVEERFTTIVVHPGQRARIDAAGNYVITIS